MQNSLDKMLNGEWFSGIATILGPLRSLKKKVLSSNPLALSCAKLDFRLGIGGLLV